MRNKKKVPEIVFSGGKPRAVILEIDDYEEMLERLEDLDDLAMLKKMRSRPLKFKKLEEYLKEHRSGV